MTLRQWSVIGGQWLENGDQQAVVGVLGLVTGLLVLRGFDFQDTELRGLISGVHRIAHWPVQ